MNNTVTEINGETSDGYHTFNELYEHRHALFILLAQLLPDRLVWRSLTHSDGSRIEGWFVLGIFMQKGYQITYHLPMIYWNGCTFAQILDKAPEFDKHTSKDVLERLGKLSQFITNHGKPDGTEARLIQTLKDMEE
jgi:hypothetical protein